MARFLVFNALSSSERASVPAASTVSDGMQAESRSFSRTKRKRCFTSTHVIQNHRVWSAGRKVILFKSAVDRESQVCTASYGLWRCVFARQGALALC